MRAKAFLTLFFCLGVSACSSLGSVPEADSHSAQVFKARCTQCHSWPHPGRHSPDEWDHYLKVMEGHMQAREIDFPDNEKKIIRDYLHRNAR